MRTPRIDHRSPSFEDRTIPVEFLLIHYTAGDLERALSIFEDKARDVSCHLLIAEDGEVFELVPCWNGLAKRAFHAGMSCYYHEARRLENFNDFSIGVELVNKNGNLFPFTEEQYEALFFVTQHLKSQYPLLNSPLRVLGHEHVAGWRGKADPGRKFSWNRFFAENYPGERAPERLSVCPETFAIALEKFIPLAPRDRDEQVRFWHAVSATTESAVALQFQQWPQNA